LIILETFVDKDFFLKRARLISPSVRIPLSIFFLFHESKK